ncbi:MAG: hypothetical protein EP323_05740, partial [Gammaproteobacteria bacterium]
MSNLNSNTQLDDDLETPQVIITNAHHSRVIVIGAGPVGIRFADELLSRRPDDEVHLFGDETCAPYNRIQLSALL